MKKAFTLLLLLIYFTVSTGFVISMHYCMDRFNSLELGASGNKKCDKCGMNKGEGCCHDEVKVIKLDQSHITSAPLYFQYQEPVALYIYTDYFLLPFENAVTKIEKVQHSPPLYNPDLLVQNSVFRI
jgi:hypothetical protein